MKILYTKTNVSSIDMVCYTLIQSYVKFPYSHVKHCFMLRQNDYETHDNEIMGKLRQRTKNRRKKYEFIKNTLFYQYLAR